MDGLTKTIQNNVLAAFGAKAPANVLDAIKKASAATGVNFAYMLQQAGVESSFNPEAKAKSSSASGLYQFISSTWMNMMDKYADKYGIDTEGMSKKEILALRHDPEISANMAAEFASENEKFLNSNWGGEVGPTELYMAHFLGAGGATAFLNAKDDNPLRPAADLLPEAARANRNVFYNRSGEPRSLGEVYALFDKKFAIKDDFVPPATDGAAQAQIAQAAPETGEQDSAAETASVVFRAAHNPPSNHSRFTTANASFENYQRKEAAGYGQIPGSYQNLLRSPVDLMMLTQLETPNEDTNGKSLF